MKKLFLIALAASVAACGPDKETTEPAAAVAAQVETVAPLSVDDLRETPGSVRASLSSDLAAKTVGNVKAIHVREGDRVRAGQLLAEIDAVELDAQVTRVRAASSEVDSAVAGAEAGLAGARSQYELAKSTWDRYRVLRERNSVSPQEFDEVEARYRAAEAELARAGRGVEQVRARRQQVAAESTAAGAMAGFGRIRAPFAGIVARKYVDVGAQAAPGMPLLRIDADQTFRFEAAVDDALASSLRPGMPISVRIGTSNQVVAGTLMEIVPAIDPATRTSIAKIALGANGGAAIRSGMYGSALIPTGRRAAITVPAESVARRGQLENVWVVDAGGKARLRLVRTGLLLGERVEVLSGLAAGERVIVSRPTGLADGVAISSEGGRG